MKDSQSFLAPQLQTREYKQLVKLLSLHYANPLPYPLSGAYFETLFAHAVGGQQEERKLLFDVLRGSTGWSLKTLLASRAALQIEEPQPFEVVIQRCDILRDRGLSLDTPPSILGAHVLRHFNEFCDSSAGAQNVSDRRSAFLLRNRAERDFLFFQQRCRLYLEDEVRWQWSNEERRSLMGFIKDTLALRWYRSGTQLFGVYRVPASAHRFHIDWTRAGMDETLAFFASIGVVKVRSEL